MSAANPNTPLIPTTIEPRGKTLSLPPRTLFARVLFLFPHHYLLLFLLFSQHPLIVLLFLFSLLLLSPMAIAGLHRFFP